MLSFTIRTSKILSVSIQGHRIVKIEYNIEEQTVGYKQGLPCWFRYPNDLVKSRESLHLMFD